MLQKTAVLFPVQESYEVATHVTLKKFYEYVKGRGRLGIQAYADGLLIIPKVLSQNAGYDAQEVIVKFLEEGAINPTVGVNFDIGEVIVPQDKGIYGIYRIECRQLLYRHRLKPVAGGGDHENWYETAALRFV